MSKVKQEQCGAKSHSDRRSSSWALVLLCGAAAIFGISVTLNALMATLGLYFNTSDSLPYGLYQAQYRGQVKVGFFALKANESRGELIKHGALVLVCLPEEIAQLALERNYVNAGKCPAQSAPVGKYVVATGGDIVQFEHYGVLVNDQLLPHSMRVAYDANGLELPKPQLISAYRLRLGEYLVLNKRADSFDSRYFGVVSDSAIVATLTPLLTF